MKPFNAGPADPRSVVGFHSLDCVNIIDESPGDNTVRPPSPKMLAWFQWERERLAKLGFNLDGTRITPPDGDESK